MIGDTSPCEWRKFTDDVTGRVVTQLTSGRTNSYPIYYFTTSFTRDGRFLVFHSERSGSVQLYRLDLATGEIGQLTDGRTSDSGWAIWCEWHLSGIYNHLSALNPASDEVYYFQDDEICATRVDTFDNRVVAKLPGGRMPIGQSAFSPDGSLFGFIHVARNAYVERLREREALTQQGLFDWDRDHHHRFRNAVATTLSVLDTATGRMRTVIETDFHFHHLLFVDERTLLINHPRGCAGMWTVDLGSGKVDHLRPASAPSAHGAAVNHQVITRRGIVYEAVAADADGRTTTYLGCYDPISHTFEEARLPLTGYVHTGFDPAGKFAFVEHAGDRHEILQVHRRADSRDVLDVSMLRTLRSPASEHQRDHAHPFLSPDRSSLFFTDWSQEGFSQVCCMEIGDLVS
jgi:hypothetical protein